MFIDLFYPWRCLLCASKTDSKSVCEACESFLPLCENDKRCYVCGLPVSYSKDQVTLICGQCQIKPPYYDNLSTVFWYEPPIDKLISDYKYFNRWENVRTLVELSKSRFKDHCDNQLVIHVPSHSKRIKQRGFNAVYEILKLFHKQIKFIHDDCVVSRVKNTTTQTGKTKSQRRQNVRDAFQVNKSIKHEKVLIVDEVVTTGATVNELSRCLKMSGVKEVSVWAIARTRI